MGMSPSLKPRFNLLLEGALLVGWTGALRRSELVALTTADVEFVEGEGVNTYIRRSKADQEAEGQVEGLPYDSSKETCPVTALRQWLQVAEAEVEGPFEGNIFRRFYRGESTGESAMTGQYMSTVLKRHAEAAAGLDPGKYPAHSLRAGFTRAGDPCRESRTARERALRARLALGVQPLRPRRRGPFRTTPPRTSASSEEVGLEIAGRSCSGLPVGSPFELRRRTLNRDEDCEFSRSGGLRGRPRTRLQLLHDRYLLGLGLAPSLQSQEVRAAREAREVHLHLVTAFHLALCERSYLPPECVVEPEADFLPVGYRKPYGHLPARRVREGAQKLQLARRAPDPDQISYLRRAVGVDLAEAVFERVGREGQILVGKPVASGLVGRAALGV